MSKYDLNDPTDVDIMRARFNAITADEWEVNRIYVSENWKNFHSSERNLMNAIGRSAGRGQKMSGKQLMFALSVADKVEQQQNAAQMESELTESVNENSNQQPLRHVTFRVAWHDDKWNGKICTNPKKNRYCSGFHSLLSERLRKRKTEHMEEELEFAGTPVTESYVPPCFWSVNLFGQEAFKVEHDNPAEPKLRHIDENLPRTSLFSWPFALAFNRVGTNPADGSYPRTLETVRIPLFNDRVKEQQSVAFFYTKYSNPFTEEDQQYLVIGCGLVTGKGGFKYFGPQEAIQNKRNSGRGMQNFPAINWALRYSFSEENILVRMPYHEYLSHAENPAFSSDDKTALLDKIKVAVTEPELEHCFKYVAMDVGNDEAIYILYKMRQRLLDCERDAIVSPQSMREKINAVESLLVHCWDKRGYFPGLGTLARLMLDWKRREFPIEEFLSRVQENEGEEYGEKISSIFLENLPDAAYREYRHEIRELQSKYKDNYDLTDEQFLQLSMLDLKPFQFERILSGKLKLKENWKKNIDLEQRSHYLPDICINPYLLYEDYMPYESFIDNITGEDKDGPISLFKIDIAYFSDIQFRKIKLDLQYDMRLNDERRLRALILNYLDTLEQNGHCFADAAEVQEALKKYPLFYHAEQGLPLPPNFLERLKPTYQAHFENGENKLKVQFANDTYYFYLKKVYYAEGDIESVIEHLLRENDLTETHPNAFVYIDKSCAELRGKLGDAFEEDIFRLERQKLLSEISRKRFYVVTGTPGSGKSYEIQHLIEQWQNFGQPCLVLAPTGKAALRLRDPEKGIEPQTIDKFIAEVRYRKISAATLARYQNIIVDELSMVDLLKLRDLLNCFNFKLPAFKRLIFVGDPNQLPAIGYGKVLRDIIYYLNSHPSYNDNISDLQTNCRSESIESLILTFSDAFTKDGEIDHDIAQMIGNGATQISDTFHLAYWKTEEELKAQLLSKFTELSGGLHIIGNHTERLNQLIGLNADGSLSAKGTSGLDNFQILTPYRADFFGTGMLNDLIQDDYKPELLLSLMGNHYKQSDKLIRTRNYYRDEELILSNGSIGLIQEKSGSATINFPELKLPMPLRGEGALRKSEQEYFELAYAITVHKSQGSAFNHVFLILPDKISLLSKELLYTALTRSKQSVTLFIQQSQPLPFEKSLFERIRRRTFTESRRTTLLLDRPFRYYALEVDGQFIESRVELLIYQSLKHFQSSAGEENIQFYYEQKPVIESIELPMKTDFTVITPAGTWYWEHLGRLGQQKYEWTWQNVKKPSYQEFGAYHNLVTTHERNGINPAKIDEIIRMMYEGSLITEDPSERYSLHHYSIR